MAVKVESMMDFRYVVQKMQKMGNKVSGTVELGYNELRERFENIYLYVEDDYICFSPDEKTVTTSADLFLGYNTKTFIPKYSQQKEIAKVMGDDVWSIQFYPDSTVVSLFECEDRIIVEDNMVKYIPTTFGADDWVDLETLEYITKIMSILKEDE